MTETAPDKPTCGSDYIFDYTLAFLALRLFLGLRMLMGSIVKFELEGNYGFEIYQKNMARLAGGISQYSFMPEWMTKPYAMALPWVMLIIGVGLLAGLKTRWMLIFSTLTYISLGFGLMAVQEDQGITNIAVYVALSAAAFCLAKYNRFVILRD